MQELRTFGRYLRAKFKRRVKKIPLGLEGFTCPNIDGTVARGGCTFCENESFSPNLARSKRFFLNPQSKENPLLQRQLLQITTQYRKTMAHYQQLGYQAFLAYFQAFTNTYAPLSTLQRLYEHALAQPNCVGLSIGTRSDSVTEELLDYLVELDREWEVWIEYGIQSVFDETLQRINRGHDVASVKEWIEKTKERGLRVCGHLIFGLPGETREMMLASVAKAVEWGCDAIKIHPLYVVKNTALAIDYQKGRFTPISQEEYIQTLVEAIKLLPPQMIIQRVTAGIGDESLLAPAWCANKNSQLKAIRQALKGAGYLY
ncbi:MAG: TIGR01212 family radical SAM protein [Nitratiruptor sp.]|nr:TIGR01212 family radical SAM protein [Nitratiruptor sp.]NPA83036.1 TIGR01212 family radical SAM protein [Campylobacterota bacterium]